MNRRSLLKFLPAVGAAIALPGAKAIGEVMPSEKDAQPIRLVRTCDGEWKSQQEYEAMCMEAGYPLFRGCGMRFSWFVGMLPTCPNCGRAYLCTLEDVKSGRFRPKE